jgi:drug/metabolite transporter (DMT)-like permease
LPFFQTALRRAYDNPWLLIALACVFWAGNAVAARVAIGEISPMLLVSGRWGISCLILLAVGWRPFLRDWPALAPHWLRIGLMGCSGFTLFTVLFYVSAHYTTGVNLAIIQGVSPVFVLLGAWVTWRTNVTAVQAAGCALTLVGVALVATHGDLFALGQFDFRIGDLGVLAAAIIYSGYTLSLRNKPKSSAIGFFVAMMFAGLLSSLPFAAWEGLTGRMAWPSATGWMVLLYTAIFPSLLAQLFFIRAVELLGPGRATLFFNLTPVLGAIFSAAFLHEAFEPYHAAALAFVIGGVVIAERFGRRA